MLLLGYDIGSSAIKAALLDAERGTVVASARSPADEEMTMEAPQPGWAEQPPSRWWHHVQAATAALRETADTDLETVAAVGLTYQMHGLVLLDAQGEVLRPSIIWCDSRAVDLGREAFEALGREWCLAHLLNSPGNFTASKLAWVHRHEPEVYDQVETALLPGDYVAFRMTGERCTTPSGLSEATLWDVQRDGLATDVLDYFDLDPGLWPDVVPTSRSRAPSQHRPPTLWACRPASRWPTGPATSRTTPSPSTPCSPGTWPRPPVRPASSTGSTTRPSTTRPPGSIRFCT
jgi:xylulokinase